MARTGLRVCAPFNAQLWLRHLDVGRVKVPEGGQRSRQTVCAAAHPHCLKKTGGHTCLLTQTLPGEMRMSVSQQCRQDGKLFSKEERGVVYVKLLLLTETEGKKEVVALAVPGQNLTRARRRGVTISFTLNM